MVKLTGPQEIPEALLALYIQALTEILTDDNVRKRYPFRVPTMQDPGKDPTPLQREQRAIFQKCVRCYNRQPATGGETPPAIGPRARTWWFDDADGSGLWYYDYFMQQTLDVYIAGNTPDWCQVLCTGDAFTSEFAPNKNYGSKDWLQVGQSGGQSMWSWVIKNESEATVLRLWVIGTLGPIGAGETYYLDFYVCNTYWYEGSIKWSNQPADEGWFYTETLLGNDQKFIEITVPAMTSVIIKSRMPDGAFCTMASSENATTAHRPIWIF